MDGADLSYIDSLTCADVPCENTRTLFVMHPQAHWRPRGGRMGLAQPGKAVWVEGMLSLC